MLYYLLLRGAVAQLIRALRWQRRGPGFESPWLHQEIIFLGYTYETCDRLFIVRTTRFRENNYAKKIVDEQGALSLSIDDEMIKRYGVAGIDYPTEKRNEYKTSVMEIIKSKIVENIRNGQSVVLDFGVRKKMDREYFRDLVESNGAEMQLIYLKASRALLLERLNRRADIEKGNNFIVTPDMLDERIAIFEEPNNENEKVIIQD